MYGVKETTKGENI